MLRTVEAIDRPLVTAEPDSVREGRERGSCVVVLPVAPDGVHRWHPRHVLRGREALPTLETYIAARVGMDVKKLPVKFRVQYRDGVGSLPFVLSKQVMQDKTLPGLFTDTIVLLGIRSSGPLFTRHIHQDLLHSRQHS